MACNKTIKYNNIIKKISCLKNSFLSLVLQYSDYAENHYFNWPQCHRTDFFFTHERANFEKYGDELRTTFFVLQIADIAGVRCSSFCISSQSSRASNESPVH